jgi:protein DGCR14
MVNGFKLVSMAPSPYLSVTDSPLMTWGEVESTPYRLQGCDTPLHAISGPGFTIKVIL